jgi:formiminotetrahydrofolate cyclodeaminase
VEEPWAQLEESVSELVGSQHAPGGGSAAAAAVVMAAGLVGSVARESEGHWDEAKGTMAQAASIADRVAPLVKADTSAYREALDALADRHSAPVESRDRQLEDVLERAAAVPFQICEAAADAAELAALVTANGEAAVRADAAAAAVMAEAAAASAALLVEINLATLPDDPRLATARELATRAADERERALRALA